MGKMIIPFIWFLKSFLFCSPFSVGIVGAEMGLHLLHRQHERRQARLSERRQAPHTRLARARCDIYRFVIDFSDLFVNDDFLGGKSPVYVHRDADLEQAANRITWFVLSIPLLTRCIYLCFHH